MYKILNKEVLANNVVRMKILAPNVALNCDAGQFIILMVDEFSERIPLTIADFDRKEGTIDIIFQIVGESTLKLNTKEVGDSIFSFVGPLGNASHVEGLDNVCVIGGGVGSAIAFPIVKKLHNLGKTTYSIAGFRNKDLVILENEFRNNSTKFVLMSDDGSVGKKGFVTNALRNLIEEKVRIDHVFAIGPLIMMKNVVLLCKEFNIPVTVSMNPIMIDGTGMCGGCRLTVDGKIKFACVDGPEFDGTLIDFDEAIKRNSIYKEIERKKYDEYCNLLKEKK